MRQALLMLLVLTLPDVTRAEETAAFLKLGAGARAQAMGGAAAALAGDVSGLAANPAGLFAMPQRELGVTHAELAAGTRYDFLGLALPTSRGTWAATGAHLSQGSLEGRDESGRPTGGFSASDSAITLGYGAALSPSWRLGGSLKYVRSALAEASAQTFAADLGAQLGLGRVGPGAMTAGLAVLNLGPGLRFAERTSPLPLTIAAGLGCRLRAGLTIAADVKRRPYADDQETEVSVGTEYALLPAFALRAGYSRAEGPRSSQSAGGAAALNGLAAGFGLKLGSYSLDYAMAPSGELGRAQRFSLGARF